MRTVTDRVEESVQLATRARIFAETYNGADYFKDLSFFLRDLLKVRHVLLAPVADNQLIAESFCTDGSVTKDFIFELDETVYHQVQQSKSYYNPGGLREHLLDHDALRELKITSFMGTALYGSSAVVAGLLAVMDRKKLENPDAVELVFAAVMSRTAREIVRFSEKMVNSK